MLDAGEFNKGEGKNQINCNAGGIQRGNKASSFYGIRA